MHQWKKTMIAGLLAGVVLACGDSAMEGIGQMMIDAGNEMARPQGQASAQAAGCKQWQVKVYQTDDESDYCKTGACTLPAGWEPFSPHNNNNTQLWTRRCAE